MGIATIAVLATSCAALLPTAQSELRGGQRDFDDAKRAFGGSLDALLPLIDDRVVHTIFRG